MLLQRKAGGWREHITVACPKPLHDKHLWWSHEKPPLFHSYTGRWSWHPSICPQVKDGCATQAVQSVCSITRPHKSQVNLMRAGPRTLAGSLWERKVQFLQLLKLVECKPRVVGSSLPQKKMDRDEVSIVLVLVIRHHLNSVHPLDFSVSWASNSLFSLGLVFPESCLS